MKEDLRCCGTGTCLINADGECWCGQRWDGEKMCFPDKLPAAAAALPDLQLLPDVAQPSSHQSSRSL